MATFIRDFAGGTPGADLTAYAPGDWQYVVGDGLEVFGIEDDGSSVGPRFASGVVNVYRFIGGSVGLDQFVELEIDTFTGSIFQPNLCAFLRMSGDNGAGNDRYQLEVFDNNGSGLLNLFRIYKVVDGTPTLLVEFEAVFSNLALIRFSAVGAGPTVLTVRVNGVVVQSVTDSTSPLTTLGTGLGGRGGSGRALTFTTGDVSSGTAPSITDQPDATTVTEGATATFNVAASGTGTLTYQWQVNTGSGWAAVSSGTGGTTASYTTPATTLGMSGYQYRCIVTGDTAPPATSSAAALTVNAAAVPPTVTTHPSPQSVVAGSTATFTAAFSGTPSPTVQWQRNPGGNTSWADIAGAVSLSYTTPATTLTGGSANNGDTYRAVATNAGGNAVTNPAPLTVTAASVAPSITAQPQSVEVAVGATATFSVVATGTAPLSYQWRRNGVNISGATSSAYTTPATVLGDDGDTFDVVVSNGTAPNATSSTATLTVSAGFDVDLEPVAIGNTGSGVRANQAFEFSAWRNGVVGSLAGATLVEGSGLTASDGVATIQLPLTGVWRVEREFADGGDCVEYVTVT